jgi:hypothetical protein
MYISLVFLSSSLARLSSLERSPFCRRVEESRSLNRTAFGSMYYQVILTFHSLLPLGTSPRHLLNWFYSQHHLYSHYVFNRTSISRYSTRWLRMSGKMLIRTHSSRNDLSLHYESSNFSSTCSLASSCSRTSLVSTRSSTTLEQEKYQLGKKKSIWAHGLRAFRHRFFRVSRRLFSVVLIGNLVPLLLILASPER